MLHQLVIAPIVLGALLAAWIAFQSWVRKQSPGLNHDADVLRGRFSCGTCLEFETCHALLTEEQPASVSDAEVLEVDGINEIAL